MKRNTILLITIVLFGILSDKTIAAIQPPTLTYATNGVSLTVSWTSDPEATGYELYYAPYPYTGENTVGSIDVGDDTAFNYTLWEGAAYYIAVKAYNSQETSDYSNIESFTIPYTSPPDAPQLFYELDGTSIYIHWSPVLGATGYLLGYHIRPYTAWLHRTSVGFPVLQFCFVRPDGSKECVYDETDSVMTNDLGNNTSFSYSSLSEGMTYTIALQAYNEFGTSDYSNIETFTVSFESQVGIAGTWAVDEYNGPNTCGEPEGGYVESYFVTVQDTGMFILKDNMLNGVINDNVLSWSGNLSYPQNGGTTTITSINGTVFSGWSSFEGSANWFWNGSGLICNGRQTLIGTRAP